MKPSRKMPAEKAPEQQQEKIHYLPMKIEYNGKVDVQEKFESTIRKENGYEATEFRGYPLKGQDLKIPHGYVGVISQPCNSLVEDGKIKAEKIFKEMTYWNYDTTPSGMDSCVKLMDWVNLANKIHVPVSEEDNEDKTDD